MEKRQETMAQIMRELKQKIEKMLNYMETSGNAEAIPNQMRTTLTSAKRVIELQHPPKIEKTPRTMENIGTPRENYREAKGIALYLYELNNSFVMRERSFSLLNLKAEQYPEKIPELETRADFMGRKIKKIEEWRGEAANLLAERKTLHFWQWRRKKEIDRELELIEEKINVAQHSFNSKYHVSLDDAPFEIERIRKEIDFKRSELDKQTARATEIEKELDAIEIEYRNQKQIADNHPDRALIYDLLEQIRETPATARASLHQMQLERRLNTITEGKNK
jgi:hypothetical protein